MPPKKPPFPPKPGAKTPPVKGKQPPVPPVSLKDSIARRLAKK